MMSRRAAFRQTDLSELGHYALIGVFVVVAFALLRNAYKHPTNGWIIIFLIAAWLSTCYELEKVKKKYKTAKEDLDGKTQSVNDLEKKVAELEAKVVEESAKKALNPKP